MNGMLDGITVIDITNNFAGPCCSAMMSDHGANVIHIEKPVWGDDSRHFLPIINGTSSSYCYMNRNKKSVVLDLKDPKGAEVIKNMVKTADVLLESNRPGVMKRLGLDYEALREINPQLIYCSVSAFGQHGPYSGRAGYDIIAQAYCGMLYYTTSEPNGKPARNYFGIGDFICAYNAYGSIMTALFHRSNTGRGQYIDVAIARSMLIMNMYISDYVSGFHRQRLGNHSSHLCPYGIFSGPNGDSIIIAAVNVSLWEKMCQAMEKPELAHDPRFMTNDARCENRDQVIKIIEDWLNSFETIVEPVKILSDHGVPNIKAYTVDDILNDEHARECGWIRDMPLIPSMGAGGVCPGAYGFADFSDEEIHVERAAELGENNMEVLTKYGMTEQEVIEYQAKWSAQK